MKKLHRSAIPLAVLLLTTVVWIGCDSGSDPDSTGNLSGVVRDGTNQTPLADVQVMLGSAQTTTDQDGRFALREVPVGSSLTLRATAAGFGVYSEAVMLSGGENVRDIVLVRRTYYTAFAPSINVGVHLTPGVDTYRAVILFVPPRPADARGFANGSRLLWPGLPDDRAAVVEMKALMAGLRERSLELAEEHGLALMGAETDENSTAAFDAVLAALAQIADESGHPELAQAPLLLTGHSWGGCFAYDFTRRHSSRVVGFMTQKGDCHRGHVGLAPLVPGYLVLGELDVPHPADHSITSVFERNRPSGALWALTVEPGAGHSPVTDLDLFAHWMDAVLEARLPTTVPPGQPVVLNVLDEASGWLGDRGSFAIAQYAQYGGDRLQASWLPTMETAQDWQAFVTPGN